MMNVQFSLIFAKSVGSFLIPTYISNYHSINFESHCGVQINVKFFETHNESH